MLFVGLELSARNERCWSWTRALCVGNGGCTHTHTYSFLPPPGKIPRSYIPAYPFVLRKYLMEQLWRKKKLLQWQMTLNRDVDSFLSLAQESFLRDEQGDSQGRRGWSHSDHLCGPINATPALRARCRPEHANSFLSFMPCFSSWLPPEPAEGKCHP